MMKCCLGIRLHNAENMTFLSNIPLNLLRYKERKLKFSVPRACPGNSLIFMYAPPTETENLVTPALLARCACISHEIYRPALCLTHLNITASALIYLLLGRSDGGLCLRAARERRKITHIAT